MKKITIEEHWFTPYFLEYFQSRKEAPRLESVVGDSGGKSWRWWNSADEYETWLPPAIVDKLCDNGEGRLKDMDEVGIDMQVISFPPNIYQLNAADGTHLTKKVNDIFAALVKKYPDRFAAFAALFLKDPEEAANELERTVKQYGFKGTLIPSHSDGEFLDAKKYWPVFERAASLGVPVYIHPTSPPAERLKQYAGHPQLATAMWGYAAEAGLTAMRLICSGIFDEYPDLNIILGHMGEALPFWMSRIDNRMRSRATNVLPSQWDKKEGATTTPLTEKLGKLPSQYIRDNFFVTTSGMDWQPVLQFVCSVLGADKVLFALDYPWESSPEPIKFIETASISESDKEKIFHLNAERLLK